MVSDNESRMLRVVSTWGGVSSVDTRKLKNKALL